MRIKGIIFDLDGVIVFTDKFHYQAWLSEARKLGAPFDEEINHRLRGVSRMESLQIILDNAGLKLSDDEKDKIASDKNETYRALLSSLTPESVDPGTRKALAELRARGFKLAIGSSSRNTPMIMANTDLQSYFDAVSDGPESNTFPPVKARAVISRPSAVSRTPTSSTSATRRFWR